MRERYEAIIGDETEDDAEVTDAQLTALAYLLEHNLPPFVDFGVWGPFGLRSERRVRFKAMMLDHAGHWAPVECHGPVASRVGANAGASSPRPQS